MLTIVFFLCVIAAIIGIILGTMSFKKSLQKEKRLIDKQFQEIVEWQSCVACGKIGPNDAHHVTSRGAGGGDTWNNLMPLCREHHAQWHQEGISRMLKYPRLRSWLYLHGRKDIIDRAESHAKK